jgi:hypothetical protein
MQARAISDQQVTPQPSIPCPAPLPCIFDWEALRSEATVEPSNVPGEGDAELDDIVEDENEDSFDEDIGDVDVSVLLSNLVLAMILKRPGLWFIIHT